jgi:hypothetical protein
VRRIVAVFRTYPIRFGGPSGGFGGAEITHEEIARRSGIPVEELKTREVTTTTGRPRRFAEFDWVQLHRSCVLNGPTDIALTFVDYLSVRNRQAYRFEQLTKDTLRFIEEVERVSGQPVTLVDQFDWRKFPWKGVMSCGDPERLPMVYEGKRSRVEFDVLVIGLPMSTMPSHPLPWNTRSHSGQIFGSWLLGITSHLSPASRNTVSYEATCG